MGDAGQRWAEQLAAWEIPEEIRSQASADPWKIDPKLLAARDEGAGAGAEGEPPETPALRLALEALGDGGTVLDVGVGAGAAGLPLAPPATRIIGVDESRDMLDAFLERAKQLGVPARGYEGRWPDIARAVPVADVVVSNHVFYNVPDLGPFAVALTAHARRRVVVEISGRHPVSGSNPLWKHFWDLERPEGPTADDAVAVLEEVGLDVSVERDLRPWRRRPSHPDWVAHLARRLCLPPERMPEVEEALQSFPEPTEREMVTISWAGGVGEG